MSENLKQSWTAINHREHHQDLAAKRVVVVQDTTSSSSPGRTVSYEDTNFLTGDSPIVADVATDLGRNGRDGYVTCDGTGDIKVEVSDDGTNYGGQHTLKSGETLGLTGLVISKIKITWVSNSAYRILVY